MAANKETQGGYACKFVITPPGALLCQICQLVARDPQLSICCGNNFCKTCLDKINSDECCPTCDDKDSILNTFPNKLSDREIKKLLIWCKNNERGCGWRDELVNEVDHLKVCEFEEIECLQKCGMLIERPKMDDHLSKECPCRQVTCEYCHVTDEYHVIVGKHKNECLKLPLSCPNECGLENVLRNELEDHMCKCPLQKVHCKYHSIGCEAKILIGGQDEHDEACMKEHFQLMRNELAHTKEELVDLKLQVEEKTYHRSLSLKQHALQSDESHDHEGPQVFIKRRSVEYRKQYVPRLVEESSCVAVNGETAPSQLDFVSSELCRTQKEFAQCKKQSDFLLRQILATMEWRTRLDILSTLTDNPDLEVATPVIIKVTEVETKKEFKMVYKSPAFLTHPNGYKVCLCILPEGKGCRITNFSIQIMNLNTEGTELRGIFTVSLLNQLGNISHCSTKLKYEINQESQSSVDDTVSGSYLNICYVVIVGINGV